MGNTEITLIVLIFAILGMFFLLYTNYKFYEQLKNNKSYGNNEEIDKKQLEQIKKYEGIKNIMEYDINVAYGREVDNE